MTIIVKSLVANVYNILRCLAIVGQNKETLGKALNYLMKNSKNTISIPENLNRAFHNLYAYTSEEHGIRHSLLNESNLSFADARFMLIACSAFVNYLVSKADDANIKLE